MQNEQCLIQIKGDMAYLSFNHIVTKAELKIWNVAVDPECPIIKKELVNTNFEAIQMPTSQGQLKIEIDINETKIVKSIRV